MSYHASLLEFTRCVSMSMHVTNTHMHIYIIDIYINTYIIYKYKPTQSESHGLPPVQSLEG